MSNQLLAGFILMAVSGLGSITILLYLNISNRIRGLEISLASVDTKVAPLWAQVQSRIAQELHHDDPKYERTDKLLEDLIALRITHEERIILKKLLLERAVDPIVNEEEQKSSRLMIAVMDKVLVEANTITDKIANLGIALMLGGAHFCIRARIGAL